MLADRLQILKTKGLARFARHEGITDSSLREAIDRAEVGLIDADLGGGLIKQRVARRGQGRSGGYRMLVAYRIKERAVFLYGFAKSERENISADELHDLRQLGSNWLNASAQQITGAIKDGALQEVLRGGEKETQSNR